MQVVAFQCPQVFNEVILKSKCALAVSMAFVPFVKVANVKPFFNCERLRSCQVIDSNLLHFQ